MQHELVSTLVSCTMYFIHFSLEHDVRSVFMCSDLAAYIGCATSRGPILTLSDST